MHPPGSLLVLRRHPAPQATPSSQMLSWSSPNPQPPQNPAPTSTVQRKNRSFFFRGLVKAEGCSRKQMLRYVTHWQLVGRDVTARYLAFVARATGALGGAVGGAGVGGNSEKLRVSEVDQD